MSRLISAPPWDWKIRVLIVHTRAIMMLLIDSDVRNNAIIRTSAIISLEFALATAAYGMVYFRKMGAIPTRVRIELITVRTNEIIRP